MSKKRKSPILKCNNSDFIDSATLNSETFQDYENRFKRLAMSVFEWVNLPESMDSRFLEEVLYFNGMASLLYDETFGFINTACASSGNLNIYNIPTKLNCYSFAFSQLRSLYTGLKNEEAKKTNCILVYNNQDRLDTFRTMELFAYRMYQADRISDVNINAQRTPYIIGCDEDTRLSLVNMYNQVEGNQLAVFTNKDSLTGKEVDVLQTTAPFVADKLQSYKKEIYNEALTYLGINNIIMEKKERLISDEANSNNELINMNLQSFLIPRQKACKQFNDLFGLTGTDKEISVRVRSDLHNIIKNTNSVVSDFEINMEGSESNV